jgi:hypothetical protein
MKRGRVIPKAPGWTRVIARFHSWLVSFLGRALAALGLCLVWAAPALAGPPYVSDDPEPTDLGHWEVYGFVSATGLLGETAGEGGFDINYGAAKDLQLTAVVPIDFQSPGQTGLGDIELAVKYKFLHQSAGTLTPDVAFFPRLFAPTASHRDGPAQVGVLLPLWAQKDIGPWSVFGGGGYDINPGPDNRNFWLTGLAVTRALGDRWSLGGEIYRQTADTNDGRAFSGVNIGASYKLTDHWTLMAAGGPGVENARQEGRYAFYAALLATY